MTRFQKCPRCWGYGQVAYGISSLAVGCSACAGSGWVLIRAWQTATPKNTEGSGGDAE